MNIVIDIETVDPNLKELGPGTFRKDGRILGVAIAPEYDRSSYYITDNFDQLKEFNKSENTIIGHNLLYDLEWLRAYGIEFREAKLRDTMVAEFIIDDQRLSYSLNDVLLYNSMEGKYSDLLQQEYDSLFNDKKRAIEHLDKLPINIVAKYAKQDAKQTLELYKKQQKNLQTNDLIKVFEMECDLYHYYLDVRFTGLKIDLEKAHYLYEKLNSEYELLQNELWAEADYSFDIWSNDQILELCKRNNIPVPESKGLTKVQKKPKKPQLNTNWYILNKDHPFWSKLHRIRELHRLSNVFIKNKILDLVIGDRLYYRLIPTKGEFGGAVSSRTSSRNPNMQQVPKREGIYAKEIRSFFIPEDKHNWLSIDESQTELRMAVHYASILGCRGSNDAVQAYMLDNNTDFHQYTADVTGLDRFTAKTINFALLYGASSQRIADTLGKELDIANEIINQYNRMLPFANILKTKVNSVAKTRGFIKTLFGAHCNFKLYGPSWGVNKDFTYIPLPYHDAIKKYGPKISRYFVHKALNRLIQRSCAEVHKQCLLNLYREGYLCVLPVHDEINLSVDKLEINKAVKRITEIILESVRLVLPRKLDIRVGEHW